MKLPKPKAVIFDWDNTLVDTWPIIHNALIATQRAMGHKEWSFDETRLKVRKSMRDSFPEIFGDNWQKAGAMYQQQYRATHLEQLQALPRAQEVLEAVKRRGLYSVVVSNKKSVNLNKEVEHIGWKKWFDKVVGSDDAARDKPFVDPVHLAFEKSGVEPGPDVWFVGDSEIDLECAFNCGCTAILYGALVMDHPDFTKTHYQGFPYHAHVYSHDELLDLLKSA